MTLIAQLLGENSLLETLELSSSAIGVGVSSISSAIARGRMPLTTLHLAENNLTPHLAIELIGALRAGAPGLLELDLSSNPICGVEEGGADEFTPSFVEVLCSWLQEAPALSSLLMIDVALCGQARDGNGSYQSQGIALLIDALASGATKLRSLSVTGCRLRDDDAHMMGKALSRNLTLERLVVDKTALMVQQLSKGERLSLNAVDFSEIDATLMAQLLLHNAVLTSIDLGGTKPLAREIKVGSPAHSPRPNPRPRPHPKPPPSP